VTAHEMYDKDSPLVRALAAPATAEELRGEEAAVLAYRAAMRRPRLRRRGLRVASGIGMTAAASSLLVPMTAVTAAAYSAALPHRVQRAAHQLFHRLGVPAPDREAHRQRRALSGLPLGATAAVRPTDLTSRPGSAVLLVRVQATVVPVGHPEHVWLQLLGELPAGGRVTLEQRAPGSARWSRGQSFALTSTGQADVVLPPVAHALEVRGRLVQPGRASLVSATAVVRARPTVTVVRDDRASGDSSRIGAACLTDAGEAGRVMRLEELVAGHWHDVQQAVVTSGGRASFEPRTGDREGHVTLRCALAASALYDASGSFPFTLPAASPA
jgi:hypothetical protein